MLSLISAGVDKVGSFLVVLLLVFLLQTPDFIKGSPLSTSNNLSDQDAEDSTVLLLSVPIEDDQEEALNLRPIIGILAQELPKSLQDDFQDTNYSSYIGAAYVKYVESAGARVVPVLIDQDDDYYETIFKSTNGLLIPGGAVSLSESGYAKAGKKLYEMAKKAWKEEGDPWPIWGTCLGFELLARFSNNDEPNLTACHSQDQALPLDFSSDWSQSFMRQEMPQEIVDIVSQQEVTINFHRWCLTPQNFSAFHMDNFWKMLATGTDLEGLEFIALLEAKDYPMWGVQFHPEKNPYEWTRTYKNIPHSKQAIDVTSFFAGFLVEQSRKSKHQFENRQIEEEFLIYNYSPAFTGRQDIDFSMQQSYLFP